MERYDLVIIGAGPAGLSAAIEAARCGMNIAVYDENKRPGGQLFKQIHKFFGSKEHHAKERGFHIGEELLAEADRLGVDVSLDTVVTGLYPGNEVMIKKGGQVSHVRGDTVLLAAGASENMAPFDGWTLPGVIGAGAAQTMMNLHGIRPGSRVLMLGSGNVGLVVSYQLLQTGCEVAAVVDAAPKIGGYGVHAAKLARCGVPFRLSSTIVRAKGGDHVEGAVIGRMDEHGKIIPGSETEIDCDTICIAVGLSPMNQLARMSGCRMEQNPKKGGCVPVCNEYGETSVRGLFAAGDAAGIEEASSAMIEGRIAGIACANRLGFLEDGKAKEAVESNEQALDTLRQGMFAPKNRGKQIEKTDEGFPVSQHLLVTGFLGDDEVEVYPGVTHPKGLHPVIECTQNIPCNPCQDACPHGCIHIGSFITALPAVEASAECIGCGRCVASCSGQAIFLVNEDIGGGYASVTMPYEFMPLPEKGDIGLACSRDGQAIGEAEVLDVKSVKAFDHTNLLTIRVPAELSGKARFYKAAQQ